MVNKKKNKPIKSLQSIVSKNLNLPKIKVNPAQVIEETKNKIGNLYVNFKKDRQKEKIKAEKKRKLDEKKELLREKRQAQKDKLNQIREEKRQIITQQKLLVENEKQVRKNEEKRKKI